MLTEIDFFLKKSTADRKRLSPILTSIINTSGS